MNFFKSVFSDDSPESPPSSDPQPSSPSETLISDTTPKSPFSSESGWSFGGLIQTLSSKSESVLETYRRDLQEFSTGFKSETQTLKHVAATSLDFGASKAQVSLESVGQAIDTVSSVVADIIFHGGDQNAADHSVGNNASSEHRSSLSRDVGVKYSRFESQLRAIQMEESTYVEEPSEDGEEFEKWKLGFDLGEHAEEVDELLVRRESGVDAIYTRVVPSMVDRETFWLRYFYRVYRLKQAEFVRARLVKRAIEAEDEEEELSWDVDDEEEVKEVRNVNDDVNVSTDDVATNVLLREEKEGDGRAANENMEVVDKEEGKVELVEKDEANEVGTLEGKGDASESSKDSDISVVSTQPSFHEEEDLGWDEIENIGSGDDEKKRTSTSQLGSPDRAELRKRLSTAEDDEDLSWDIEDDDEPIKS